jgi:hypothetical protein
MFRQHAAGEALCKGTLAHKPPTTPRLAAHFWPLIEASAVPGREPPSRNEQRQCNGGCCGRFFARQKRCIQPPVPRRCATVQVPLGELQVPQQRVFDGVDLTGQEGVSSSRSTEV